MATPSRQAKRPRSSEPPAQQHPASSKTPAASFESAINQAVLTYLDTVRLIDQATKAVDKLQQLGTEQRVPKSIKPTFTLNLPKAVDTPERRAKIKDIENAAARQVAAILLEARQEHVTLLRQDLAKVKPKLQDEVRSSLRDANQYLDAIVTGAPSGRPAAGAGLGAGSGSAPRPPPSAHPPFEAPIISAIVVEVTDKFDTRLQAKLQAHALRAVKERESSARRAEKQMAARQQAATMDATQGVMKLVKQEVRAQLGHHLKSAKTKTDKKKTDKKAKKQGNGRKSSSSQRGKAVRFQLGNKKPRGSSSNPAQSHNPKSSKYVPPHARKSSGQSKQEARSRRASATKTLGTQRN